MNRQEFTNQVQNLIKNGYNVNITGPKGCGKTHTLKQISDNYINEPKLTKTTLQKLTNNNKGTKTQLYQQLLQMTQIVISIDNLHHLTTKKTVIIEELSQHHTILGASKYKVELTSFVQLKMPKMTNQELMNLISDLKIGKLTKIKIVNKSNGNPGKLITITNTYLATGKLKTIDKSITDLLDYSVINIFFSVRYMFMALGLWNLYAVFSMIAYTMRGLKYRKRKK